MNLLQRNVHQEPIAIRFGHLVWSLAYRLTKPLTQPTHFKQSFIVGAPPKDVYAFWRDFTNLARVSQHIASIESVDDRHSRWVINAPLGLQLSWKTELTVDEVKRRIAWKTTAPADIPHTGQVIFHGVDDGTRTEVAVAVDYRMPLGIVGELLSQLLGGGAKSLIEDEVMRFKAAVEGAVASVDEEPNVLREARDIETGGALSHPEKVHAVANDTVEQPEIEAAASHEEHAQPKKKHKQARANGITRGAVVDQRHNLRNHH